MEVEAGLVAGLEAAAEESVADQGAMQGLVAAGERRRESHEWSGNMEIVNRTKKTAAPCYRLEKVMLNCRSLSWRSRVTKDEPSWNT